MGEKTFKPPTKNRTAINGVIRRCQPIKGELLIGSNKHEYQSLIEFDITSLPCLLTLVSGTLNVYLCKNWLSQQEKHIAVHQIVSPWCVGKAPVIKSIPVACAAVGNSNNFFVKFDITSLVLGWYTGNAANFGILLRLEQLNKSREAGVLAFCSKQVRNSQRWPFLEVAYLEPSPSESCCQTLDFDVSVTAGELINTTAALNIQRFNYTYFIVNRGIHPASVSLQVSPDGLYWLTEEPLQVIAPGIMLPLVPNVIARFARLTYQATMPNQETILDIRVRGCSP